MLSRSQLGHKPIIRIFTYFLIFGFAFLLFIPSSFQLRDLFFQKNNHFIEVNGEEVFFKPFNLIGGGGLSKQKSIEGILQILIPKNINTSEFSNLQYQLMIRNMLSIENSVKSNSPLQDIFSEWIQEIFLLISHKKNAEDSNLEINPKDLYNLIEKTYKQNMLKTYQGILKKSLDKKQTLTQEEKFYAKLSFSEFLKERYSLDWNYFYKWAIENLKTQYLISIMNSSFSFSNLVPIPQVKKEIDFKKEEVQVEYLFYSPIEHADFLKNTLNDLDYQDIERYYNSLIDQYVDVKYIEFKTMEKAMYTRTDANNFSPKSQFNVKNIRLYFSRENTKSLFNKLFKYSENEITDVLENVSFKKSHPYAIYKIIKKSPTYKSIEKDVKNKKSPFLKDYFINRYSNFEKSFNKRLLKIKDFMKKYQDKNISYKKLINLYPNNLANIVYVKTKFFPLNTNSIEVEETNQKIKKISPMFFNTNANKKEERIKNILFFQKAFSMKVGEKAGPIENIITSYPERKKDKKEKESKKNKYIFFIQKANSRMVSLDKNIEKTSYQEIYNNKKGILIKNWLMFLMKKNIIEIKINFNNIFKHFNLL